MRFSFAYLLGSQMQFVLVLDCCHALIQVTSELACQYQTPAHLVRAGAKRNTKKLGWIQRGLVHCIPLVAEARPGVGCRLQYNIIRPFHGSEVRLIQNGAVQLIQRPS